MRRVLLLLGLLALLTVVVACSGGTTQAQPHWVITDLGTLGGRESEALAINDRGQIVGSSYIPSVDSNHAFLWQNGKMTDLGVLHPRWESEATDINDHGQIVGWVDSRRRGDVRGYAVPRAALWQGGKIRDLGTVHAWDAESEATAINSEGRLVGTRNATGMSGDARGFLWHQGKIRDLGKFGEYGKAEAISSNDVIVGSIADDTEHAFLWKRGVRYRLAGGSESGAADINGRGQIVGWWSQTEADFSHATLWENGRLTVLPGLPGARGAAGASGINERGQIVGWSETRRDVPRNKHAVLWTLKRG